MSVIAAGGVSWQVIEIICLSEHLLTECEAKDLYEECPKSGMAVKKTEKKAWSEGPHYKAKPSGNGGIETKRHLTLPDFLYHALSLKEGSAGLSGDA